MKKGDISKKFWECRCGVKLAELTDYSDVREDNTGDGLNSEIVIRGEHGYEFKIFYAFATVICKKCGRFNSTKSEINDFLMKNKNTAWISDIHDAEQQYYQEAQEKYELTADQKKKIEKDLPEIPKKILSKMLRGDLWLSPDGYWAKQLGIDDKLFNEHVKTIEGMISKIKGVDKQS